MKTGLIVAGLNHAAHIASNKFFSSESKAFKFMEKQFENTGKEQACYIMDNGILILSPSAGTGTSYPYDKVLPVEIVK